MNALQVLEAIAGIALGAFLLSVALLLTVVIGVRKADRTDLQKRPRIMSAAWLARRVTGLRIFTANAADELPGASEELLAAAGGNEAA